MGNSSSSHSTLLDARPNRVATNAKGNEDRIRLCGTRKTQATAGPATRRSEYEVY